MLLALIIVMAMFTFGLLFSGWLTPARVKADEGGGNSQPQVESCTNCVAEGSVTLDAPTNTPIGCIGSSISVSAEFVVDPAEVKTITTNSDGSTTTVISHPNPTFGVINWTASVGGFSAKGIGLTAVFTPTNSGCGTVNFTVNYTNPPPCSDAGTATTSGNFSVSQLSTNCTSGTVALGNSSPATNFWFSPGLGVTFSATNNNVTNSIVVTTHDPCGINPDTYVTNLVTPTIITNWWTINYGSFSTNHAGLSAAFTPTNPGSGTVTFNENYKDNTPCNTNVQSATPITIPFNVISVTLTNMGFANGNHQISKDDGSGTYPSPEWQLLANNLTTNYPTCYTRNTPMTVTPYFIVIPSSFTAVLVKGISSGPQLPVVSGWPSTVTSTSNFHNNVDFLNPLTIDWQASLDNGTNWHDIATSANKVYVTWADTLNPIYTLLDAGCKGAQGVTGTVGVNDDSVLNGVWGKIQSKSINRASDNVLITYYGFYDVNKNGVWNTGVDIDYNAPTGSGGICGATTASGLISVGNGQCGSWADFMNQVLRAQGLSSINGVKHQEVEIKPKSTWVEFAVNNWAKTGSSPRQIISSNAGVDGSSAVTPNPANSETADAVGASGQGNSPNPPSNFGNHYIGYFNGKYYDPSYGLGPYTDLKKYEIDAFAGGIRQDPVIGFVIDEPPSDDGDPNNHNDEINTYGLFDFTNP